MIIVVDTTKAGSASNTFVLPIIKDTTETVKIYWGDGTNSTGVNGNNTCDTILQQIKLLSGKTDTDF